MTVSPWAVIKCKFSDDRSDTPPDGLYERLFTAAGAGSFGMVDYFRDMSHGSLDVGGSRVFGWFTLPFGMDEFYFRAQDDGQIARRWLMLECRRAAEPSVDFRQFRGVVATMNRGRHPVAGDGVDLWGSLGGMEAFCDYSSLSPSLLGQEMGHGYGLDHSLRDGSVAEYGDPWDTMSTQAAYMAPHPEYGRIGPGLNAVNMMIADWFDLDRLWYCSEEGFSGRVRLRPLHRHDLPGSLAASLPYPYRPGRRMIVEYRPRQQWDSEFPQSVVLLHREAGRRSHLMRALTQGDVYEYGRRGGPSHVRVRVARIDDEAQTCDLDVTCSRPGLADDLRSIVGPLSRQVIGGVPYDGSGAVILPGGQIVPIGPWDPTLAILQDLGALYAAEAVDDPGARLAARRAALVGMIDSAQAQLDRLSPLRSPAPAPDAGPVGIERRRGCLGIALPRGLDRHRWKRG